jgi:hypothetical protein
LLAPHQSPAAQQCVPQTVPPVQVLQKSGFPGGAIVHVLRHAGSWVVLWPLQ